MTCEQDSNHGVCIWKSFSSVKALLRVFRLFLFVSFKLKHFKMLSPGLKFAWETATMRDATSIFFETNDAQCVDQAYHGLMDYKRRSPYTSICVCIICVDTYQFRFFKYIYIHMSTYRKESRLYTYEVRTDNYIYIYSKYHHFCESYIPIMWTI